LKATENSSGSSAASALSAASAIVQKEKHTSKERRERIFANGKAAGIEEGTKLGIAQGLTKGKESAAREIAALKATNEALHKRIGELLEQSNGNATGQLVATETATKYLVENTQLRNLVAAQERELGTLKQINEAQEKELAVLRISSAQFLGQSGHLPVLGSVRSSSASAPRPGSSPYIRRPPQP
jgi:DNA invertase Pin-like site-specific DNA recombinase